MPILTIQRAFRELGRIRAGDQQEYVKDGIKKHRPTKGTTFRLTSASQSLIERVSEEYGGVVQPWGNAPEGSGPQWECTVTAPAIDVLVPPGQTYSQWMELWRGGGCVRRCDGRRGRFEGGFGEHVAVAERGAVACLVGAVGVVDGDRGGRDRPKHRRQR